MTFFKVTPLGYPKNRVAPRTRRGLGRFIMASFIVFAILNGGNLYWKGKTFLDENSPIAFAGFHELTRGVEALREQRFSEADVFFRQAEESLQTLRGSTRYLTAQTNRFLNQSLYLDTANKLMEGALAMAELGQNLTNAAKKSKELVATASADPMATFKNAGIIIDSLLKQAIFIQQNLTTLNARLLPDDMEMRLNVGQKQIGEFLALLRQVERGIKSALKLLGEKKPHDYLILLQNQYERRATGGFIGSYILMTIHKGKITKLEPHDVYESDGQLTAIVPAPPGIDQVADRWTLRDANYSPDFPTSARQILWFLEAGRGPSADTVIALDQTVATALLTLTGPIELKGFPFTIKAGNFDDLLSFHIEAKLAGAANPKQLLFDLIPVIKERLFTLADVIPLISTASRLIEEEHLKLYSSDEDIQTLAEWLRMDGKLPTPANTDTVQIVSTSIGGNKSDRYVRMEVNEKRLTAGQGMAVTKELIITKRHTWTARDFNRYQRFIDYYGVKKLPLKTLRFILGEGPNVDYMRLYVPAGSHLISSEGILDLHEYSDAGHTVFAFTMEVAAGQSKTVALRYTLPSAMAVAKK